MLAIKIKTTMKELPQIIKEEIIKLPKQLRDAISYINWQLILEEISREYVTEEEFDDLRTEVVLVLIGAEYPEFLAQNIEDNLGLSNNDSIQISKMVFEKIFSPIAEKLQSLVKNEVSTKNYSWQKTINFIVSGGDYSVFIEK